MKIGGIQEFSLIDYPGKIACVIFTLGCNFRCPFCHNPELVIPALLTQELDEDNIFVFLSGRKGKLEGIVLSGGEPTIHDDLPVFLKKIKDMGFFIKIDTNGTNPDVIKDIIGQNLVDYISMDIKAPYLKYNVLSGSKTDIKKIDKSINIIQNSGLDYMFRTTFYRKYLNQDDIFTITDSIKDKKRYVIQKCRDDKIILENFSEKLAN